MKTFNCFWKLIVGFCLIASSFLSSCGGSIDGSSVSGVVDSSGSLERLYSGGLIARYYIDEAASGAGPAQLLDSASDPVDLPLTYAGNLTFTEIATGRGLNFSAVGQNDRACIDVTGTKFMTHIHGSTTGTLEVVFDIQSVSASASRLVNFGEAGAWRFTIAAISATDRIAFEVDSVSGYANTYNIDIDTLDRAVITAVFDSTQALPNNRMKLYIDGVLQSPDVASNPPLNYTLDISQVDNYFCIGNREITDRTPLGKIYYAAVYNEALSVANINANVTELLGDDDQ